MLGMLGISQESLWILIVVVIGAFLAFIMLMFFAGEEGPGGFAYKLFRSLWYDLQYFFFGPRIVEV